MQVEKIVLGALGGLAAVLTKFLGQDYANIVEHASNLTDAQIESYKVGYIILTPILMFLGALVAWASEERKRFKLVALAVAAPALITTWAGGTKGQKLASFDLIAPAYAQPVAARNVRSNAAAPEPERGAWDKVQSGVGIFFGYGRDPQRYWVIVGSYKDKDAAQKFADALNKGSPDLHAWVGLRLPDNPYYPVIVGEYALLSEAKVLKQRALSSKLVKEAYLSADRNR